MRNNLNKKRLYEIPDVSKLRADFCSADKPNIELYGGARGGGKSWFKRYINEHWNDIDKVFPPCDDLCLHDTSSITKKLVEVAGKEVNDCIKDFLTKYGWDGQQETLKQFTEENGFRMFHINYSDIVVWMKHIARIIYCNYDFEECKTICEYKDVEVKENKQ